MLSAPGRIPATAPREPTAIGSSATRPQATARPTPWPRAMATSMWWRVPPDSVARGDRSAPTRTVRACLRDVPVRAAPFPSVWKARSGSAGRRLRSRPPSDEQPGAFVVDAELGPHQVADVVAVHLPRE